MALEGFRLIGAIASDGAKLIGAIASDGPGLEGCFSDHGRRASPGSDWGFLATLPFREG